MISDMQDNNATFYLFFLTDDFLLQEKKMNIYNDCTTEKRRHKYMIIFF